VKTRGDGVRGLNTPSEWGAEAGAAAPPAGCAHTTARGGAARGRHHRVPTLRACDSGRPLAARLRPCPSTKS